LPSLLPREQRSIKSISYGMQHEIVAAHQESRS